jgi:hypothetical protein
MISPDKKAEFTSELSALINRMSIDNDNNTPDFELADMLTDVLDKYPKQPRNPLFGIETAL